MKIIRIPPILFFVLTVPAFLLLAQPKIPKEKIPSDIDPAIRVQIEQLYSADPKTRVEAVYALAQEGYKAICTLPFLVEMLWDFARIDLQSGRTTVAQCVINPIAKIGEPAVSLLISALKNRKLPYDAYYFIQKTLGKIGGPAVQPLISALESEQSNYGHTIIAEALAETGKVAVNPLLKSLKDKKKNVRAQAAYALGIIGDKTAVAGLIEAVKDRNKRVRCDAAEALGKIGDDAAVKPLIVALKMENEDSEVQNDISKALGKIGKAAVEPLIPLLKDDSVEIRRRTIESLTITADRRAIQPIIAALQDESDYIREEAVHSLGILKDQSSVPFLIRILKDEQPRVRREAADALGLLRAQQAVKPLIKLLTDRDWYVRYNAAGALGRIGDVTAGPALIEVFNKDSYQEVRYGAADALGNLKYAPAFELLAAALQQDKRWRVAWALGEIGDARAIPVLIAALQLKYENDAEEENVTDEQFERMIKGNIEEVLLKMTGQCFGQNADKWQKWWEAGNTEQMPAWTQSYYAGLDKDYLLKKLQAGERVPEIIYLDDPRMVEILTQGVKKNGVFRTDFRWAVNQLVRIQGNKASDMLFDFIENDTEVSREAGQALKKILDDSMFTRLSQIALSGKNPGVETSIPLLGCYRTKDAEHILCELLKSNDDCLVESALNELEYVGSKDCTETILPLVDSNNTTIGTFAVETLGSIWADKTRFEMNQEQRQKLSFKKEILYSSGRISATLPPDKEEELKTKVVAVIFEGMKNPNPGIVSASIRAISALKLEQAIPEIERIAETWDVNYYYDALEALSYIGGDKGAGALVRLSYKAAAEKNYYRRCERLSSVLHHMKYVKSYILISRLTELLRDKSGIESDWSSTQNLVCDESAAALVIICPDGPGFEMYLNRQNRDRKIDEWKRHIAMNYGYVISKVVPLIKKQETRPASNESQDNVTEIECLNNLKNIGKALIMYAYDHDGRLPDTLYELYPLYVRDQICLQCPGGRTVEKKPQEIYGYTYVKNLRWGMATANEIVVVFYKSSAKRYDEKYCVLFLDGHTAIVSEKNMKKLLQHSAIQTKAGEWYSKAEQTEVKEEKISYYTKIIALDSQAADAYCKRGEIYFDNEEFDKAIKDFNKAVEISPESSYGYLARGRIYLNNMESDKAIKNFNKVIEISPNYPTAFNCRGCAFLDKKYYDKALEDFNKAIELIPEYVSALFDRGNLYGMTAKYDLALKDFSRILGITPEDADAYIGKGHAYLCLNDYGNALDAFKKAMLLNPKEGYSYLGMGVCYRETGNLTQAIEYHDKAIALMPNEAEAYGERGVTYAKQGNFEKSMKDCDKAFELDKNDNYLYYDRGLAYYSLKKYDLASKDFKKYLKDAIDLGAKKDAEKKLMECIAKLRERFIKYER